jgi:hypothetical protein
MASLPAARGSVTTCALYLLVPKCGQRIDPRRAPRQHVDLSRDIWILIDLHRSLFGCLMPLAQMRGTGIVGGRIVSSDGIFFWTWTLVALGVTALFSVILSARGLWSLRRGQSR